MFQGRRLIAGLALVASLFAADAAPPDSAADALTTGPVDGVGVGEWTARWWRWALNQPVPPYLDPDGRLCELGQDGPVWFLAGTNGRFRPKRECHIPDGKYLLVPVINMVYWQRDATEPRLSCDALQASAAVNNDHLRSAVALLDDKPVGDVRLFRVRSEGCFPMDPDDPASLLAAADGYWLMIRPLSRGRHTLVVGANYGDSEEDYAGMHQNFEYVLDVGGPVTLRDRRDNDHPFAGTLPWDGVALRRPQE
jgi:hypothetical protein